jgi:hypothetical protein
VQANHTNEVGTATQIGSGTAMRLHRLLRIIAMHQNDNMTLPFSRGRVQRLTALLGAAAFLILSTNVTPLAQEGSTAQPPFPSSNSPSGLPPWLIS